MSTSRMYRWLVAPAMIATLALVAAPAPSSAQIVAGGDVGGFGTFIDSQTNLQWLRLDNFSGLTPFDMVLAAGAQGFTLATLSEVQVLWASLPLGGGGWASYQPVLGDSPYRGLYWGLYDTGVTTEQGWGYAYAAELNWHTSVVEYDWSQLASSETDLNLWAYRSAEVGVVPEPATMTLFATGLLGIGAARRRKQSQKP